MIAKEQDLSLAPLVQRKNVLDARIETFLRQLSEIRKQFKDFGTELQGTPGRSPNGGKLANRLTESLVRQAAATQGECLAAELERNEIVNRLSMAGVPAAAA